MSQRAFTALFGGTDPSLRDLWFEALNADKFGWIDIDNPAELDEKEHKEVVSKVSKMLAEAGRRAHYHVHW